MMILMSEFSPRKEKKREEERNRDEIQDERELYVCCVHCFHVIRASASSSPRLPSTFNPKDEVHHQEDQRDVEGKKRTSDEMRDEMCFVETQEEGVRRKQPREKTSHDYESISFHSMMKLKDRRKKNEIQDEESRGKKKRTLCYISVNACERAIHRQEEQRTGRKREKNLRQERKTGQMPKKQENR